MTRPHLLWIATGGTIAGTAAVPTQPQVYTAGAQSAAALYATVPALADLAELRIEQPFCLGSEHLTNDHWLRLAQIIRHHQHDPACAGIVITHGTDTLEETALFLDLVCPRTHAMVITGAMRPANALSADGPRNLYAAARVALDPASRGGGVMVVMNDEIFAADRVAKQHTTHLQAFGARDGGALGQLVNDQPIWRTAPADAARTRPSLAECCTPLPATLPRVDLIQTHVDADPKLVPWLLSQGARALVVAGTGHGTLAQPMLEALIEARRQGCLVIRASRLPAGPVGPGGGGIDDAAHGFIAAHFVAPHKARLVAALALACHADEATLAALLAAL